MPIHPHNANEADARPACPFCDHSSETPQFATVSVGGCGFGFAVICEECGATGPNMETQPEALEAWSTLLSPTFSDRDTLRRARRLLAMYATQDRRGFARPDGAWPAENAEEEATYDLAIQTVAALRAMIPQRKRAEA